MGDKETPQHDEDVTGDQTQDTLLETNVDKNDSEDKDTNVASNNKECKGDCPTEGPDISPEHTNILKSPKDIPPLVDIDRGDCQPEEPSNDLDGDNVDIPDGAPVPFPNEGEDNPVVSTEETTETTDQDDVGNLELATENQKPLPQEAPAAEKQQTVPEKAVETIGPTPHVESAPLSDVPPSVKDNKRRKSWIAVAFAIALVAVLLQQLLLKPKDQPQKTKLRQIDIFHQEMEKVKVQFPSQREELWKRSRIHLQRHFHITQPTEPVSIILTAGVRAEGTLRCLAQSIASALSSALNASSLHIDGASKSSQDSDKVKSDIDSQLQKAFEGGKPIAVIHRFEELPPASTLIFYRYCDHENAAFKKTFLIFTVLLGEEEEIHAKICLSEVEEMVTDHLQKKFLSHGHPSAFDKMDIDKYGGLWSRISHLILPVATENRIEKTEQC